MTFGIYKPVARKIRPVQQVIPEEARVVRQFPEDPLLSLPPLTPHPPDFTPTQKLTAERLKEMDLNHDGFLWPEEEKLFAYIYQLNEHVLALEETDRGTFRDEYFSPYRIPVIDHQVWVDKPIPIPPGHVDEVTELLKEKI